MLPPGHLVPLARAAEAAGYDTIAARFADTVIAELRKDGT
jgi:hypothetical protein